MNKLILGSFFISLMILLTGCNGIKIDSIRNVEQTETITPINQDQIQISSGSFSPKEVIISVGETIIFTNVDNVAHTVASDQYPTDNELPGLFSPVLYKNQQYAYTFKEAGLFGVHLEDNPSILAKITVK